MNNTVIQVEWKLHNTLFQNKQNCAPQTMGQDIDCYERSKHKKLKIKESLCKNLDPNEIGSLYRHR